MNNKSKIDYCHEINIYVSNNELNWIKNQAKELNISISEVIRCCIRSNMITKIPLDYEQYIPKFRPGRRYNGYY